MKNTPIKFGIIIVLILLLTSLPTTITGSLVNKVLDDETNVIVKDIRFGFRKITATVENNGNENTTINVTFWVHDPPIISPHEIGKHTATIQVEDSIEITQEFRGLGACTFYVSLNDSGYRDAYSTQGFWFFFFGIELPIFNT